MLHHTSNGWRRLSGPERFVGTGFRTWMAGYATQDIASWETCWNEYATELGPQGAKQAISELSFWVRSVKEETTRQIETFPHGCDGFCKDECLAVAIVAACQHQHCPAMMVCAQELIGTKETDRIIETADHYAYTLKKLDVRLGENAVNTLSAVA